MKTFSGKRPTKSASKVKIARLGSSGAARSKGFVGKRTRPAAANRHTPANG